jgi:L-lactate dehydrogenase complex protein LldE
MRAGLFIPCYINQFYPRVGIATLELLEKLGVEVSFPLRQTCCGQPMANSGFEHLGEECNELFLELFHDFDYIICPSGSCTLHIKEHLHVSGHEEHALSMRGKIFELSEFLTDILHVESLPSYFPYKVGIHQSCHGQRGLKLSQMSELVAPPFSKPEKLLRMVEGLTLVSLTRTDECCGFGGLFSVNEEAVSVRMGKDRIEDFTEHGVEYITGADMSCLMHLEGLLRRQNSAVRVMHLAEILNAHMR